MRNDDDFTNVDGRPQRVLCASTLGLLDAIVTVLPLSLALACAENDNGGAESLVRRMGLALWHETVVLSPVRARDENAGARREGAATAQDDDLWGADSRVGVWRSSKDDNEK